MEGTIEKTIMEFIQQGGLAAVAGVSLYIAFQMHKMAMRREQEFHEERKAEVTRFADILQGNATVIGRLLHVLDRLERTMNGGYHGPTE